MKYLIGFFGILSIIIVTLINFYPEEVKDFIKTKILQEEYILAKENDYFKSDEYRYFNNYTDDINNKKELINYIYYVINTGSTEADGECNSEYINCTKDLDDIANDEFFLSTINNFVHPYNSFSKIQFIYKTANENNKGVSFINNQTFSIKIEHVYSEEDIASINYAVNNIINKTITDSMSDYEIIRIFHDYIINNTAYDSNKTKDINDTTYRSNTAYGVFIDGMGICSGYSDAMAILLNEVGIKNYKISNDSHIWNLVYINGVWAHLDTTWDDPISEYNANRDTYFLIDYDTLNKINDGTHLFDKKIYLEAY